MTRGITDQHGTSQLRLDNTAQVPTWRQETPYGAPRGATVSWPDNRAFLNKPADDSTGLTTLGARQYDPVAGSFISLDPLFTSSDPLSLNGYAYADNNPIGRADPTGLQALGASDFDCGLQDCSTGSSTSTGKTSKKGTASGNNSSSGSGHSGSGSGRVPPTAGCDRACGQDA